MERAGGGEEENTSTQPPPPLFFTEEYLEGEYGLEREEGGCWEGCRGELRGRCGCTRAWWVKMVLGFLPILEWLPNYSPKNDLIPDIIAGLTVGIMHIPQGMAYASLAGLDPIYGLYTSFFPSLFYMFFGTSRHVSLGVFAVVSLMVGSVRYKYIPEEGLKDLWSTVTKGNVSVLEVVNFSDSVTMAPLQASTPSLLPPDITPIHLVTSLTLLIGIIQLFMAVLRLGFVSSYLSDQVVSGFTTGAAIHVLVAQINKLIGVKLPRYPGFGKLFFVLRDLALQVPQSHVPTLIVSVICIVCLVFCKEVLTPRLKKAIPIPVPFELILVTITTAVSYLSGLEYQYDIKVVQDIPTGLPSPKVPDISLFPLLVTDAVGISVVVFAVTVSMGKLFAKKYGYKVDPNQELYALGLMEVLCSFVSVYPASTALARSLVYEAAGVRSQCVLSSIIVVALKGMFMQFRAPKYLFRRSKIDFSIWVVSFVGTVVGDVMQGLIISVGYGLITVICRSQKPYRTVFGRVGKTSYFRSAKDYSKINETEGMKIFHFDSPLIFTNVQLFRESLMELCGIDLPEGKRWLKADIKLRNLKQSAFNHQDMIKVEGGRGEEELNPLTDGIHLPPPNFPLVLILDCSGIGYIDNMGVNTVREIYQDLKSIYISVILTACTSETKRMFKSHDIFTDIPLCNWYLDVDDAVNAANVIIQERKLTPLTTTAISVL